MADNEDDPAVEGIEVDMPEETPGYKAPEMKTLDELQTLDADDESLVRYKQTLLGQTATADDDGDPRNVVLESMAFCSEDRVEIPLDLTGDLTKLKENPITIKEGCSYRIKITFRVKKEIVAGLKLHLVTTRKGITVNKESRMVGSYGPKAETQSYTTPPDEAPKGMIARGRYKMNCKFIDDDKNVHLQWEWAFDIKKDWDKD